MEKYANAYEWSDEEIVEISTTIDESNARKSTGAIGQVTHQRTNSGNTQSSTSLDTVGGRCQPPNAHKKTWADVVAGRNAGQEPAVAQT